MVGTFVFLFFLCLTYAAYLLATRKSEAQQMRVRQRLAEALNDQTAAEGAALQLSREGQLSGIPLVASLLARLSIAQRLQRMISQAGMQMSVTRLLTFCALAGLMALLAAFTVTESAIVLLLLPVLAAIAPIWHISWKRRKRINKFLEHLPGSLELMGRALAAGHPFSETLQLVAEEMPEPICSEFRVTFEEQKLGLSLKLALEHLCERVPLLDLRLCVTAIIIQRETGGNLGEVLDKVAETIRERFKLMADLRAMTASSRGSAWILCLFPPAIGLLLTALNPDNMSVLWNDPRGHKLLFAAFVMQTLGVLMIRRILKVKF